MNSKSYNYLQTISPVKLSEIISFLCQNFKQNQTTLAYKPSSSNFHKTLGNRQSEHHYINKLLTIDFPLKQNYWLFFRIFLRCVSCVLFKLKFSNLAIISTTCGTPTTKYNLYGI